MKDMYKPKQFKVPQSFNCAISAVVRLWINENYSFLKIGPKTCDFKIWGYYGSEDGDTILVDGNAILTNVSEKHAAFLFDRCSS